MPPDHKIVSSATTPNRQLVDGNGKATFEFLKWLQGMDVAVNSALTPQGGLQPGVIPATQPMPTPLTAAVTTENATAGGASALPATPEGYLEWTINGQVVKVPFYLP